MTALAGRVVIRGAQRLAANDDRETVDVLLDGGVIRAVGRVDDRDATIIHAENCLVVPGFIDVHIHGAGGDVFEQANAAGNARICAQLAQYGTVGVVATLATLPPAALRDAVASIARTESAGARIVGIHLEGPYLNPRRCGAQNPSWMRPPSIDEFDALQQIAGGSIRMVTVAPELDGAIAFIRALRTRTVTVAIGHTEATTAQVEAAIDAGATHVTHLFNAMSPLHHRMPDTVGVALTDDGLTVELICDGHHLHPRAVDLVFRAKSVERIVLVSDGVAAGIADGARELFGVRCDVRDGAVRMANGQLAGSCLTLDAAVRNVRAWSPRHRLADLLASASTVPARVIALQPGSVEAGARADLIVLSNDMRVAATFVQGRCVWQGPESVGAQG